ncbi:cob(I)yrinic acid a,c-diamide adenosyltransferase [Sunxiuqinia sp. A32]|uniref:cob(I)yrinic acid a,c-diamide adenosyltransferase n=1 Tax=Sunxiuqinia sp. A32 TaxID=3461496 RepID=UPI0040464CA4
MSKITRVYTKTGDDGTTGLIGGSRVKKYDVRLEAYGTVDELNSHIGLIIASGVDDNSKKVLQFIQNKLFVIGSQLATDDSAAEFKKRYPCKEEDIKLLENEMDTMFETLPKLDNFILPGGSVSSAQTQIARTICRRAERRIIELSEKTKIENNLIKFINRLSDYLFVLGRKIAFDQKAPENLWIPDENRG